MRCRPWVLVSVMVSSDATKMVVSSVSFEVIFFDSRDIGGFGFGFDGVLMVYFCCWFVGVFFIWLIWFVEQVLIRLNG